MGVIKEIKRKLSALNLPKGFALLPVLIHPCGVTRALAKENFFAKVMDFTDNL